MLFNNPMNLSVSFECLKLVEIFDVLRMSLGN
jgi:hypothetical protein